METQENQSIEYKDVLLWQSLLFSNKNYRSKPLGDVEACKQYFLSSTNDPRHIEQTK